MEIDSERLDGEITKINLSGRMDVTGSQQVDPAFAELTAPPHLRVIVDLSGVHFLTSAGIRMLLVHAKALRARGGRMVLLNPNVLISRMLDLAGVDLSIGVFRDLQAACTKLAGEVGG